MKKYLSLFRIKFINGLQYRAAAAAGVATQFAWGFLYVLLYRAFYRSNPLAFPMEFSQLSSYMWLQQAFLTLLVFWVFDQELFDAIAGGQVAYELCRPLDIYGMWYVRSMADRTSKAVLRSLPILIVAAFLPEPFKLGPPPCFPAFALFILSMVLAFLLVVAFCMLVYISVFYTLSPTGTRTVTTAVINFLTGTVVPLPFFPPAIRRVAELLPFASMGNTPFRIYSGNIAGQDAFVSCLRQLFWLAVTILSGILWMRRAVKRTVVQGG